MGQWYFVYRCTMTNASQLRGQWSHLRVLCICPSVYQSCFIDFIEFCINVQHRRDIYSANSCFMKPFGKLHSTHTLGFFIQTFSAITLVVVDRLLWKFGYNVCFHHKKVGKRGQKGENWYFYYAPLTTRRGHYVLLMSVRPSVRPYELSSSFSQEP